MGKKCEGSQHPQVYRIGEGNLFLAEAVVRLSGKGITVVLCLLLTLNTYRRSFERFICWYLKGYYLNDL